MGDGIKKIPKRFNGKGEVKGYLFVRIKQTKKVAMYRVSYKNHEHYEVFVRKTNTLFNNESYPSRHQFGISAFTYFSKEGAEEKFNRLDK